MIPRPSIIPEALGRAPSDAHGKKYVSSPSRRNDVDVPIPDYPRDDGPSGRIQERSADLMRTRGYYDYYPMYGTTPSAMPPYGYYNYGPAVTSPGNIYDPYSFWDRYNHYPLNQNIYTIPPGTRFETIPQESTSQDRLQSFEVESITGEGIPYSVRNVSNGKRFVVEYPTATLHHAPAPIYRYHAGASSETALHSPKFPRFSYVGSPSEPVPVLTQSREPTGSTSSYTEGSIHTRSGPHFMNGVDYLDVSTRSRILTWLNNSNSRPIRLRPVGQDRTTLPGAPLRYRIHSLSLR